MEQILEEVQSKECRAKELENRIATLLSVVADRDKQMAESDAQIDQRNRQFDEMMARLLIHDSGQASPSEKDVMEEINLQTPATLARSNKRPNTSHTPQRGETAGMECSMDDPMTEMSDDPSPIIQC